MSLLSKKLRKAVKKGVKKYGKVAARAGAAYVSGGASEAYYAKAQAFGIGKKKAKARTGDPYSATQSDPYSEFAASPKQFVQKRFSSAGGGRFTARGIMIGG